MVLINSMDWIPVQEIEDRSIHGQGTKGLRVKKRSKVSTTIKSFLFSGHQSSFLGLWVGLYSFIAILMSWYNDL